MQSTDDSALLRQYAEEHSDEAFAALVERHVNLVYSVALRQVGQPRNAEEICQAVFIILARKAAQLRRSQALSSWLFQTTRLTANNFIRSELRRHRREQEAYMQTLLNEPDNTVWPKIAPLLDAAVAGLNEQDRQAVLLRFYQGRNFREIGSATGVSEAAAEKRIKRAVEKLRKFFMKRGVDSTASTIAETISAHSIQVAPVALVKTVTTVAIAKGATASISTLTLIKGALNIMAWTKAKTAIVAGVAVIIVAGTATLGVKKYEAHQAALDSWRIPRFAPDTVATAMPQVRILPTKFKPPVYGSLTDGTGKWAGVRAPVRDMVRIAYDWPPGRIVFPAGEPTARYDYATTLAEGATEALQQKIRKTLGFVARPETKATDVMVLKVRNPDAPGLKPHLLGPANGLFDANGGIISKGLPISMPPPAPYWGLTRFLEMYLQMPVVDETGLTGRYDIEFRWQERGAADPNHDAMKQVLLDQLGLELVSTNMPVEMLVVEKTK
jgi:RNA polymerase sigma factor (sigma-70 family)